jgi:hypothetical protein
VSCPAETRVGHITTEPISLVSVDSLISGISC